MRIFLIVIAAGMIWLGLPSQSVGSDGPLLIPLETAAPAPVKQTIAQGKTPQEICIADRLMSFAENEHHTPAAIERNAIVYGCLGATWAMAFDHFAK